MSYVHGHSICCAQGADAALWRQWAAPLPAATMPFVFLKHTVNVPYFRAFAAERLHKAALGALIHQYIQAAAQAAGWSAQDTGESMVFIGSSAYGMADAELRYLQGAAAHQAALSSIAQTLSEQYGYAHIFNFATSCTSAAQALLHAHRLLQSGLVARALVVGVESFNLLTLAHFYATGLLAAAEPYPPFMQPGFILGEGIACLALSATAPARGGLRLCAAAANTDGGGLTEMSSDSMAAVMRQALAAANVPAGALQLVKAHAVGSPSSDEAERQALHAVLRHSVPVTWFKPHIGHTLGASGVIETALLLSCLQAGRLPEALSGGTLAGMHTAKAGMLLPPGYYLTQFSGFGGSNVSLVWAWQP